MAELCLCYARLLAIQMYEKINQARMGGDRHDEVSTDTADDILRTNDEVRSLPYLIFHYTYTQVLSWQ